MNWEAIAAIGQAVGALAVVISLLYLALQVRHNTRAVRGTTADATVQRQQEWMRMLIEDADVSRIWGIGQENPAALSEEERRRYYYLATAYLGMAENFHYHYLEGTLDPKLWDGARAKIFASIGSPGVRAYWKLRRHVWSEPFLGFIDSIHAQAPVDGPVQASRRLGLSEAVRSERDSVSAEGVNAPVQ